MILKKEFYFLRHGQTDHNLLENNEKGDHPGDIPLNETGKSQAKAIEPLVALLPVQTICISPMLRTEQTKEIVAERLNGEHHVIDDLRECNFEIWNAMRKLGMYYSIPEEGIVRHFMERVVNGINQALSLKGPTLIVGHGGTFWTACCVMGIKSHVWLLDNCGLVHFTLGPLGEWNISLLHKQTTTHRI